MLGGPQQVPQRRVAITGGGAVPAEQARQEQPLTAAVEDVGGEPVDTAVHVQVTTDGLQGRLGQR